MAAAAAKPPHRPIPDRGIVLARWRFLGLALVLAAGLAGAARAQTPEEPVDPADAAPPVEEVTPDADVTPVTPPATGAVPVLPVPEAPSKVVGVVLQGLDKVTARISTIEVPLDGTASFGTLTIRARQCVMSPADEKPEASAFLEIADTPPGQPAVAMFSGWMFASSPALSALEHPVYDVWVTACKTAAPGTP